MKNTATLFAREDVRTHVAISRRESARVLQEPCPSKSRGRREGRVRAAPAVSRAKGRKHARALQVQRRQSGLPCAMVLTVSFALSPVTGFLATVLRVNEPSRNLTPALGASGPHDFAVRIAMLSSAAPSASTASRPNVRDDRETPLCVGRDQIALFLFLPRRQAEFLKIRNRPECPVGVGGCRWPRAAWGPRAPGDRSELLTPDTQTARSAR